MPRRSFSADAVLSAWSAPDGWSHRRYDRPGSGAASHRGQLLFLGGRADSIEKYLESFDHWHARGWAVTSIDWRGQGGSGRLGPGNVGHLADFDLLVHDLRDLWSGWRSGEGPAVVVAHSMGGYLALAALVRGLIDPAALVLVAPMLGLRNPLGAWIGGRVARLVAGRGDPARAAWRQLEVAGAIRARQRRLTHDLSRFEDERWWYDRDPGLRLGPPSWSWIVQAFAATAALRGDPRLSGVRTPVQFLVADHDRLVDPRAARAVAARLPQAELHRFGRDAAHEILREVDPVRNEALGLIDAFLDAHAPA